MNIFFLMSIFYVSILIQFCVGICLEQIGTGILEDLHSQRETLQRSRERVRKSLIIYFGFPISNYYLYFKNQINNTNTCIRTVFTC